MERVNIEAAKKKLYNAAKSGDVEMFKEVLQEDPNILDEVSFECATNVLYIATLHRQPGIVEEVLNIHPQLARDLDSKNSSFLHFAAAQGSCGLALKLLSIAPEMLWWRDWQNMNPIHIAAMNGHVQLLWMMIHEDSSPAMERLHRGQTVLHLCVKHGQLGALKALVSKLGGLVCAKDDDGETVLHLAVRSNELEAIQYLAEIMGVIKKETRNSMGKAALDILHSIPRCTTRDYSEIKRILTKLSHRPMIESVKLSKITMVVVGLIATTAFQVGVNPPGGIWQDTTSSDAFAPAPSPIRTPAPALAPGPGPSSMPTSSHTAGGAIMASTNKPFYRTFASNNAIALVASLITIFLIITGLPSQSLNFLWLAMITLWISISSIVCSYLAATLFISNPTRPPPAYLGTKGMNMFIYVAGLGPMGCLFMRELRNK